VAAALVTAHVVEHWRSRAAELSQHDWLTNALSRPFLEERLTALCSQRQRSLAPVSLVMFDVDRFKNINDAHGRQAGDEVLEMLVSGIKAEIRASDFIGRYGGDEFLLVLDECEGNSAVSLLDRLRARFQNKPMTVGDAQLKVSFAAGIVSVNPGDPLVLKDLLRNAERALENSKEAGRNRTAMAPPPPPSEPPPSKGPITGQETQIVG
jgi:diguanylate cyclase (GGDEF)-like protein